VTPEFLASLGIEAELIQAGALDGLSREEVEGLAPGSGDYMLVTRMNDGSEVIVSAEQIHRRMENCIRHLEEADVEIIVLFCTGEFPALRSRCPILKPDLILKHLVEGILPRGRLGIMFPSPEQGKTMKNKWRETGLDMVLEAASPYTGSTADFRAAGERLAEQKSYLIVLDCIGYTAEMKAIVRKAAGRPVILPRTVLGRVCGELLEGKVGQQY
jgi:protein AroM